MERLNKYKWLITGLAILLCLYYWMLPNTLFHDPYSTVLIDANEELLSAAIASDGQWRFPEAETVPDKFSAALMAFEDKRFLYHPGIDPVALARAVRQNMAQGSVVSGGSTITMQLARLSRKGRPRTVFQKLMEMMLATRLELRYSKEEILALYASHAPFGGNVVGLKAACWRYFARDPRELSWAEAALLAVLPNSPSLLHPGKNRSMLKAKRDRLLDKLKDSGRIDAFTCSLSKGEPLPDKPQPLPQLAGHLLTRASGEGFAGINISSTLDRQLQASVEQIVDDHHQQLKGNQIHNIAALVVEVSTGNVLAYVGNTHGDPREDNGQAVDVVTAPRSTGSILKPFLYAAMLDEGRILPRTLLPDIPMYINGFSPKNFSKEYDGAVPADQALIRSLNVPAVHLLRDYRYEKFYSLLKNVGMTTLHFSPDHYGLSLILGGAEGTLWDITGMYASMTRTLNNYFTHPGSRRYDRSDFHPLNYVLAAPKMSGDESQTRAEGVSESGLEETSWLSAASIYQTFDALKDVYRPGEESGWRYFSDSKRIAWKTGTSFGFRDAWAVGITPEFVVGVWVGNADGEGRPGLTGTDSAAPVMFDIFSTLSSRDWFHPPAMEMERITVCAVSGQRSTAQCDKLDTVAVVKAGLQSGPCTYHRKVHLSEDGRYQLSSACTRVDQLIVKNWFVLPPVQAYYYKAKNISYKPLPPYREDCGGSSSQLTMELVYPKPNASIYIPLDLDGSLGNAVFHLAHRNPNATVHWHLDGTYLGSTNRTHKLPINASQGRHTLVLIDENGEALEEHFEVLSKM